MSQRLAGFSPPSAARLTDEHPVIFRRELGLTLEHYGPAAG